MESRAFALSDLHPNPFRDLDAYPVQEEDVEALISSFDRSGAWADGQLLVRVEDGTPQLAFGHARVEAMRRHLGPDREVEVAVADLSDAQMLRRMVDENEVRRKHSALLNQEVVTGVVQGYAEGRIELESPPKKTAHSKLRYAPSFIQGHAPGRSREHRYTAKTVADYLGWDDTRVEYTLGALELIERGRLEMEDFWGEEENGHLVPVGRQEARSMVENVRKALRRRKGRGAEEVEPEPEDGGEEDARPEEEPTNPSNPPPEVAIYLDVLEEFVEADEAIRGLLGDLDQETLTEIAAVQASALTVLEERQSAINRLQEEGA